MPNTMTLIASSTVGAGGAATISFSSIPSTYTDLVLKCSLRGTSAVVTDYIYFSYNGSTTSFTARFLEGSGSAAGSYTSPARMAGGENGSTSTASSFSNLDIYIPNYAGSTNKSASIDSVSENNATAAYMELVASLWSNTSAINQVTLTPAAGTFVQYSTAYLYGVKNA